MIPALPGEATIFDHARQIADPGERADYLDATCGNDPVLRRQLSRMLAAGENGRAFFPSEFESPTHSCPQPEPWPEPQSISQPTRIGRFVLQQKLAVGGMGEVYRAIQESPFRRTVAVKIIRGGLDSQQVLARFEAERQALAMMSHPNIARVIDAGSTETGRPYFVMEWIPGIPITTYCERRKFSIEQRLELLIPVCEAIQHAHHKGIIHRDIKPGNVLVTEIDGRPVPIVIDFGVAKAIHQRLTTLPLETEPGQLVGTLAYMSPEQADGNCFDIDARSDIYALGTLLYELLTGSTPFSENLLRDVGWNEMHRIISKQDPTLPSKRLRDSAPRSDAAVQSKDLRGELNWITIKCLEKQRESRYHSALELARDLRRYLNQEPVNAIPMTTTYRLRRFVARNRRWVIAAGVMFGVSLLALTSVLVSLNRVARADEVMARIESATGKSIDFMLTTLFANTVFKNEKGFHFLHHRPERHAILADLSKEAGPTYEEAPIMEAVTRVALGEAFAGFDYPADAEREFHRAQLLYSQVRGENHLVTLQTALLRHRELLRMGLDEQADVVMRTTMNRLRTHHGLNHPLALQARADYHVVLARSGIVDKALNYSRDLEITARFLLGSVSPEYAHILASHVVVLREAGQTAEAETVRKELQSLRWQLLAPGSSVPIVVKASVIDFMIAEDLDPEETRDMLASFAEDASRLHGDAGSLSLLYQNKLAILFERQ